MDRLTRVLREGLDRIAGDQSREERLAAILAHSCQWVGACRGHIFEYIDDTQELFTVASYSWNRVYHGPAPDDCDHIKTPFPAAHNGTFYSLCRTEKMRFLGPKGFLDTVWAGTSGWHRKHRHLCAVALPLVAQGAGLGKMTLYFDHARAWDTPDLEALPALATQAGLVLLLDHLQEQKYTSLLRAERNRFARELHDGLAQNLVSILMQLRSKGEGGSELEKLAQQALDEARRSVYALRPSVLEGGDFFESLQRLLNQPPGLKTAFQTSGKLRSLPDQWKHEIYRVLQEGISNATRHAAPEQLSLHLNFLSDRLEVLLNDDGRGFPVDSTVGSGLVNIRERISLLGGAVDWASGPDSGTLLRLVLPWR